MRKRDWCVTVTGGARKFVSEQNNSIKGYYPHHRENAWDGDGSAYCKHIKISKVIKISLWHWNVHGL